LLKRPAFFPAPKFAVTAMRGSEVADFVTASLRIERFESGGLTREDAVAQIDRSGRPQDFRLEEVAPGRFEVVDDGP
jgi:hypothetical protein